MRAKWFRDRFRLGNSFYNTKAGHKHSGLEQDFPMEAASECREGHAWTGNPAWPVRTTGSHCQQLPRILL